jgi:hypothetical protein
MNVNDHGSVGYWGVLKDDIAKKILANQNNGDYIIYQTKPLIGNSKYIIMYNKMGSNGMKTDSIKIEYEVDKYDEKVYYTDDKRFEILYLKYQPTHKLSNLVAFIVCSYSYLKNALVFNNAHLDKFKSGGMIIVKDGKRGNVYVKDDLLIKPEWERYKVDCSKYDMPNIHVDPWTT